MSYAVKELVYTLQGEGAQAGRAAVFCRFAGCNLWSGHEADRDTATCRFCDTDFVGMDGPRGGRYGSAGELAGAIRDTWAPRIDSSGSRVRPLVVFTGGEPALQLDAPLTQALGEHGFEIAIETNGTIDLPSGIDWVCVSPKAGTVLRVTAGDELKLIHPQPGAEPERYEHLSFNHFFVQPMAGPEQERNTQAAVAWCLGHPQWRICLQTHKILGIP